MKLIDPLETILLIIGSGLPAELKDRPLATHLQHAIDSRGEGHRYRRAVVVDDAWYLEHPEFHRSPSIAIGGPGSNGVSQQFAGVLPLVWSRDDRSYLQIAFDGPIRRATVWGMTAEATMDALDAFVAHGLLDRFLDNAWRFDGIGLM